jgi:hypothetical protein
MKRRVSKLTAVFFLLLLSPLALLAQDGPATTKAPTVDQFVGNYKGTVKSPEGDVALTLEIKSDKGKISGRLITPKGEEPLTSGEVVVSKLTIKLGSGSGANQLVLQLRDDKAVGEWKTGGQTRAVEFKKVLPATEATAAEVAKPASQPATAEALSGEWDAAADVQGQAFPFALNLKVEGDKVTGESSSQLGTSSISSGVWKDGKLAVVLEGSNGQIALIATMVDGKLVGDFDYAGQLSGKWVAVKKKP